jgi:YYY domain-containing protein
MSDILSFLIWYLSISLIGLVSLPISFRLFPKLASRGYAFIRPISLLFWGYLFWILGSLGVLQNNIGGVLTAFVLIGFLSFILFRKPVRMEIGIWLKDNWKTILAIEILFFVTFALWTVVRAANPQAAYTEKPMELAFINSILKSDTFPPQDPWLSGYSISYYYFGYVLISMLIRVTGVSASIAFNLSSSLWFAMTAAGAYGIVYDLIMAWKRDRKTVQSSVAAERSKLLAQLGGFLGPFYVLIISTLEGVFEFLYSGGVFWKAGADGILSSKFWSWLAIKELDVAPMQPFSWIPARPTGWMWWRGSRVLQDISMNGGNIEVIGEFPFFSYLLSDLHPHLLAMPFCLLALALCLNIFLGGMKDKFRFPVSLKWVLSWETWGATLIIGSLLFLNTWDFPIYAGLLTIVLIFGQVKNFGWHWRRLKEFLFTILYFGICGVILFLPFFLGFQSQAGGVLPSLEYMTRGIHFWIMFGVFLSLILVWLIYQIREKSIPFLPSKSIKFSLILFVGLFISSVLVGIFLLNLAQIGSAWSVSSNSYIAAIGQKMILGGQAFSGLHGGFSTLAVIQQAVSRRILAPGTWITLLLLLTLTLGLLLGSTKKHHLTSKLDEEEDSEDTQKPNPKVFILILILIGIGLTTFPEFYYLRDQFGSRMNTIFKFYFQTWLFWGIAAAFASVELLSVLRRSKFVVFSIFWIALMLGGLAYPIVMVWDKTEHFSPKTWTLDGNNYLLQNTPDEYLAFKWLDNAKVGIVAEAIGGSYTDYARVSTRTGLPTVLGWPGHESQWRGGGTEMGSRSADIATLYETASDAEMSIILEKYNIRYVFIGNLERATYRISELKFDNNLSLVYENGSVKIYEVPNRFGGISLD